MSDAYPPLAVPAFKKGPGLKLKFTIIISLLIIIIMTAVTLVIRRQVETSLMDQMINKGIALTRGLANNAAEALAINDQMVINELVDQAVKQEKGIVQAALVASDQHIIAHSQPELEGAPYNVHPTGLYAQVQNATISTCTLRDEPCLDFGFPIIFHVQKDNIHKSLGIAHLVYSLAPIEKTVEQTLTMIFTITAVSLAFAILLTLIVVNRITHPISQLSQAAQIVGGGNLDYTFQVKSRDEIGQLSHTLNAMTLNLKEAQQEMLIKERLEKEMLIAKEIQNLLIPKKTPAIAGYNVGMLYRSAQELSGDYLDFFDLGKGHWGMIVADVSGKGLPGGLVMTQTRSLLSLLAQSSLAPGKTLSTVSRHMQDDIQENMFITATYAVLNAKQHTLAFARAGHVPLLVFRQATKTLEAFKPVGIAIGAADADIFTKVLAEECLELHPGDFIFLYTDGIDEACNAQSELFGLERLKAAILACAHLPAAGIIEHIDHTLKVFVGTSAQNDDMTMIVLKREEA